MNIYGDRYAEVGRFIGYCQDLNVKTDERELEYYERTGVMLPVARVVYPGEFIVQLDRHEQDGDYGWNGFDEWPDLAGLAEKFSPSPRRNKALDDEDLVYCFDRAMDSGGNPYLTVPDAGHTLREEGRLPIRSIPIRSIQWYLNTVHQLRLSVGAIVGALHRTAQLAQPVVAEIVDRIRASPVVHADATGWRENGVNGYVWTFSTPTELYFLRRSRARRSLLRPWAIPPIRSGAGASPEYWSVISTRPTIIATGITYNSPQT